MTAIELIRAERERQISVEGWTPEHDDGHHDHDLAEAAVCYLITGTDREQLVHPIRKGRLCYVGLWPWKRQAYSPTPDDRIRELVKAGALVVAEIERLMRAGVVHTPPTQKGDGPACAATHPAPDESPITSRPQDSRQ